MNTLAINKAPELLLVSDKSKAEQIRIVFEPMVQMLKGFEEEYNEIVSLTAFGINEDHAKRARKLRNKIVKVRTNTEKARVLKKEECLREGKAIDGVANILKFAVIDKEKALKEIEDHARIAEEKRLEALQVDREEILRPFIDDDFDRPLSYMADDVWDAYLSTKQRDHQDRINAEDQARVLREETERIEREEAERIAAENARLRTEKMAAEAKFRAAEAEAAKIQAQAEAKLKTERDKAEAKLQVERDAAAEKQRIADAEAEKVRNENKRLKDEAAAKEIKQLRDKANAEEARLQKIQDDLNKGDTEKMQDLAKDLDEIAKKYDFGSVASMNLYSVICDDLLMYAGRIRDKYASEKQEVGL